MCGRFALFDEKEIKELHEIIRELEERQAEKVKTGEIFPTDRVPVLISRHQKVTPEAVIWGFPHVKGSGVIINARSETAHVKPLFRRCLETRRCLIPSTGFYEWSRENKKAKQKYLFTCPEDPVLYMAGLYNDFDGERRFVILTTQASEFVKDIHDRMPVVLDRADINTWLQHPEAAKMMLMDLEKRPPLIRKAV